MAKNVVTTITDDLDGSADAQTVTFGFEGVAYAIDLSPKNYERLSKALAPYIERASRVGRQRMNNMRRTTKPSATVDNAAIRQWAASHGIEISARGRIPQAVIDQYQEANGR
jgi:nucleoid-associated protein Lsr2